MKEINKAVRLDGINFDTKYTGNGETFVTVVADKKSGKTIAHVFERDTRIAALWIKFIAKLSNWNSDSKIHTLREFEEFRTRKNKDSIKKEDAVRNIKALSTLEDRAAACRILNGDAIAPEVDGHSGKQPAAGARVRALASSEVGNAIKHLADVNECKRGLVALIGQASRAASGSGPSGAQSWEPAFGLQNADQLATLLVRRPNILSIPEVKAQKLLAEQLIEASTNIQTPTLECTKAVKHLRQQVQTCKKRMGDEAARDRSATLRAIHDLFAGMADFNSSGKCLLSTMESSSLKISLIGFEALCGRILEGSGLAADYVRLGNLLTALDESFKAGALPKTSAAYKGVLGLYEKFRAALDKQETVKSQFDDFRKISGQYLSDSFLFALGHESFGTDSILKNSAERSSARKEPIARAMAEGLELQSKVTSCLYSIQSQYPRDSKEAPEYAGNIIKLTRQIIGALDELKSNGIMGPESASGFRSMIDRMSSYPVPKVFAWGKSPIQKDVEAAIEVFKAALN